MKEAYRIGMDAIREESVASLERCREERDLALSEARTRKHQKDAVEEQCDKLRALAKEAQERSVDVHRTTLEEIRRRDAEARKLSEVQRGEWAEAAQRAERLTHQTVTLKRRVDELERVEQEAKRMRASAAQAQIARARDDAERAHLREQVRSERAECEALRRIRYELENRVAVLEASTKLEDCKRALSS